MRKLIYYMASVLFVSLTACSEDTDFVTEDSGKATLRLRQSWVVDQDNLASEQTIQNIAVLLTEPSSEVITHKYINASFSSASEYESVTLPDDVTTLNSKDIYVLTNYDNSIDFDGITTLEELERQTTPSVNSIQNLDPARGFCMYGKTLDFDFNNTDNESAIVYVNRICAKYRITLTFSPDPAVSTENSFLITEAANYAYIGKNTGDTIPEDAYFDFTEPIVLEASGDTAYIAVAYVYESVKTPGLQLITNPTTAAESEEYSTTLPLPQRNYLYDIQIKVFERPSTLRNVQADVNTRKQREHLMKVTVYDENGNQVHPED